MKKIIFSFILFLFEMLSFAQKNTFGIINYTVPSGYELIKNDNSYFYYKEDKSTGAYCNIIIYKLMPGQGDVQQDFTNSWDGLMQKPFKITATPALQPEALLKGWKFIIGTAGFKENGVPAMAVVTTFSGENNLQTIVILSNADAYKADIESFIASVDVTKEIAEATTATTNQNTNSNNANTDNSIAGIWTFLDRKQMAANYGRAYLVVSRGYKFNPDGTYGYYNKFYMRGNTNLKFEYETGTWILSGNQLTIKPARGQNEEWSKKGSDGDLLGEEWGTRLKTTTRKLETITYTIEKRKLPGDPTIHLMLKYDKPTERDKDFTYDNGQWRYAPFAPNANDFPPGFKLNDGNSKAAQTTKPSSAKTNAATVSSHSKYDLWMAYTLDMGGKLGNKRAYFVVLTSDNRCLFHFPEKGLYNIEQEYAGSDSWGTVTDKGDRLELKNVKYGGMNLYKHPTGMGKYPDSKPYDYYKKCKPVDGIRIEGAYSPDVSLYKNKATMLDKIMYDPNKRPVIFFKKDGTYTNEGIEFSNITKGDAFAIGRGTYELKDFSIILTTQSGRKLQVAFAGIQDSNPAAGADGYIINNNLFYKLDNSYQAH